MFLRFRSLKLQNIIDRSSRLGRTTVDQFTLRTLQQIHCTYREEFPNIYKLSLSLNQLSEKGMEILDACCLYLMVRYTKPRIVVEFATGSGYSTAFIASALSKNGFGGIVSFELDKRRVRRAKRFIKHLGLASIVAIVQGDWTQEVPKFIRQHSPYVDFLNIDPWHHYHTGVEYVTRVLPLCQARTVIHIHDIKDNVIPDAKLLFDFESYPRKRSYLSTSLPTYHSREEDAVAELIALNLGAFEHFVTADLYDLDRVVIRDFYPCSERDRTLTTKEEGLCHERMSPIYECWDYRQFDDYGRQLGHGESWFLQLIGAGSNLMIPQYALEPPRGWAPSMGRGWNP